MCDCVLHILCDSAEIRHPFGCLAFGKERESEREGVSVGACTLFIHQRGKGALIIDAPPQSPPSLQRQEARRFSLIHVKEPAGGGRKGHAHNPNLRKRNRKSSAVDRGTVSVQLGMQKKQKAGGKE